MAYVTETKENVPVAARVGQAIGQIGSGMLNAAQLQDQRKRTEAYMQQAQSQVDLMNQHLKENQMQMSEMAHQSQAGLAFTAASSDDPKAASKLLFPRYQQFTPMTGSPVQDANQLGEYADSLNKAMGGADFFKRVNMAPALVGNTTVDEKTHQDHYVKSITDLKRLEPYMAPDQYNSAIKKIEDANQGYQMYRRTLEVNSMKLSQREDEFQKTTKRETGKTFVKQVEDLPQINQRVANIDKVVGLIDRVAVGPLAGKPLSQFAQKIAKNEAQELQFYLNKESVKTLLDFAAKGGVRGMDTPAEQERIISAIPNMQQSPQVLKKTLLELKDILSETARITKEKQDYVSQHGNLQGYSPSVSSPVSSGPKAGDVIDGYQFIGGDPSKQESWKKVK